MAEKICVEVVRVTHVKEGKPKSWIRMETSLCVCTGNMSWTPKNKEVLNLTGKHTAFHGIKQFEFTSATPDIPVNSKMLLHYVCKIAEGFGEKLEAEIWAKLGDSWEDITPEDVKGVTEKRIASLQEALEHVRLNKTQVDTVAYLLSKGCSHIDAEKAWAEWEKEAIGKVNANCYCMVELPQVGFKKIDLGVRHHFQIADNDPRRLESGVLYAMAQETGMDGSTAIHYKNLQARSVQELSLSIDKVNAEVLEMIKSGRLMLMNANMIAAANNYNDELLIWDYANKNQKTINVKF